MAQILENENNNQTSDFQELQNVQRMANDPMLTEEADLARAHIASERRYNSHPDYVAPAAPLEEEDETRSLWLDIPMQVAGSVPRVWNKLASTMSDVGGFIAAPITEKITEGMLEGRALTPEQKEQIKGESANKALHHARKFTDDYIKTGFTVPEAESGVAAGVADITDFILATAVGAKALKGFGIAAERSLLGGMSAASFSDDVEDESLSEIGLRKLVEKFPEQLGDVRIALDTDNPTDAMIRRGTKAIEDLALIITGDKAVRKIVEKMPEGSFKFLEKLPELARESFAASIRQIKKITGKEITEAGKVTLRQAGEKPVQLRVNIDNLDLEKPLEAQLGNIIRIDVDGRQGLPDEKTMLSLVDDVTAQVQEAVRGLPGIIAKEKGISIQEAKKLLPESLAKIDVATAKVQAANILVESQLHKSFGSMKAYAAVKGSADTGLVANMQKKASDDFNDLVNVALPYWQSLATTAGKSLQKTSELSAAARTVLSEREKLLLEAGRKELNNLKGDGNAYALMVEKMSDSLDMASTFSADPNVIMKHLTKAIQRVGDKKTVPQKLYAAFESSYINGILSSPITQGVNVMSAEAMFATRLFDKAIMATPGIRKPGDPTYTSVAIEFGEILRSHWDVAMLTANGLYAAASTGMKRPAVGKIKSTYQTEFKKGRQTLEEKGIVREGGVTATPGLTSTEAKNIMELEKLDNVSDSAFSGKAFEVDGSLGSAIDWAGFTIGSGYARETMRATDNMAKAIAVRKEMRGAVHNAVYVDDVLGLDQMVKAGKNIDFKQAQARIEDLLLNGGSDINFVSKIQELGFSKGASKRLASKMEVVRKQAADKALQEALAVTFQKRLGGSLKAVQNTLQNQMWGGKFIVPFFTTPTNIFSEIMYRTPVVTFGAENVVGLPIHPRFYKDFAAGGAKRREAISRAMTGNAVFILGMKMYEEGKIVPVSDGSKGAKDLEKSLGLTDMSIIDDDESINITKLAPMVAPLFAGANLRHAMGEEGFNRVMGDKQQSQFAQTWHTYSTFLSSYMLDLPFMAGPKGFIETTQTIARSEEAGTKRLQKAAARMAGAAMPSSSMLRFLSRQNDEYLRDMSTFTGQMKTLFFQNEDVPTIYNALGESQPKSTEFYYGMPLGVNKIKEDPVIREMLNTGFTPERFGTTVDIDGIKLELDTKHFVALNDLWRDDISIRERLEDTIDTRSYGLIDSVAGRAQALNSVWRSAKKEAIEELVMQFPELEAQLLQKTELRETRDIQLNNSFRSGVVNDIVNKSAKPKLSGMQNIEGEK